MATTTCPECSHEDFHWPTTGCRHEMKPATETASAQLCTCSRRSTVRELFEAARATGFGMVQTWEEDELREIGFTEEEIAERRIETTKETP